MVTLEQVKAARERIHDSVFVSPCSHSETFSQLTGNTVFLKLENTQMTGSYKERGALNKILTLTPEERSRGLIAASAGNHAQAVSYHATKRRICAQICMPLATPLNKVMSTRRFGAEVVLYGANYDEACDEALRLCSQQGLTFIHPFDDEAVIAGQGTVALELLEQVPDIEVVVTPIGGGGLISGMACALKEINPKIRVIGVQTARLPSMKAAVDSNQHVVLPVASTLADGIAVRRAGDHTLPMVQKYVDEIVTVEEEEIASAILLLLEREKTLAEGAGAVAVAALAHGKVSGKNKKVAAIVSGGNIDVTELVSHAARWDGDRHGAVEDQIHNMRGLRDRITAQDLPDTERWAPVARQIDPGLVHAATWPPLADAFAEAARAGHDLPTLLQDVLAHGPLDPSNPGRDLQSRLLADLDPEPTPWRRIRADRPGAQRRLFATPPAPQRPAPPTTTDPLKPNRGTSTPR